MIIAIDHGNYSVKTIHFNFMSGLTEYSVKPPLAADIIEYGDRIWTLTSQRISYMRDKTRDEQFFVLTLFAIAKELQESDNLSPFVQLNLAVGLPPEHYGVLKNKFAQYFKRPGLTNFVYNDIPISMIVRNVLVYPQAYAAVVPYGKRLQASARMFLVDIGGYTTDVLLLKNGKPDLQFCRSLETGIITMNNDIIGKVNSLYDVKIEDDHIADVLQGQDTILSREVTDTIRKAAKRHADNILNKLRELQVDLRSTPATFIGGGAALFRPFLENSPMVVKSDFILDPKANAIGYSMLAAAQLKKLSVENGGIAHENAR